MEVEIYDRLNLQGNSLVRACLSKFGAEKEYVKFSGHVVKFYGVLSGTKVLQWLSTGKRVLLITNAALYNLRGENFHCHRRFPLSKITSILRSYWRHQFVINIKREKARRYLSEEVREICDCIRCAQAIKCRAACPVRYEVSLLKSLFKSFEDEKSIFYQNKTKELCNVVVHMAQHRLNLINSKENEAKIKRAIDDMSVISERSKHWMLMLSWNITEG